MNLPDPRSSGVTWIKWGALGLFGYFLLHPVAGIYESTSYKDTVFILTFMAGMMGIDVPLTAARRAAWRKEVETALHTPPPPEPTTGTGT